MSPVMELRKNGNAIMYDCISPEKDRSYIEVYCQTAQFVIKKNKTEDPTVPMATPRIDLCLRIKNPMIPARTKLP